MMTRSTILAAMMVAALGASSCSTVSRLNPFDKKDEGPAELAGEGQRISIIPPDQVLEPAAALKGVDFALPPAVKVAAWALPGGVAEQAMGNVDAAPDLSIAWRKSFAPERASRAAIRPSASIRNTFPSAATGGAVR